MCYNVKFLTQKKLKYAKRRGENPEEIKKIENDLDQLTRGKEPIFHTSGFSHPQLLVFTHSQPLTPFLFQWGLIPHWVKDNDQAQQISNRTINARGEELFNKPAFRVPVRSKRCIIMIDAFYEHYYYKGKKYPFHIELMSNDPMIIAGIWDQWQNNLGTTINTVSVVTTKANELMKQIHNNPKLGESRMPMILDNNHEKIWLNVQSHQQELKSIFNYAPQIELNAFPVLPILGKKASGNTPQACTPYHYEELPEIL